MRMLQPGRWHRLIRQRGTQAWKTAGWGHQLLSHSCREPVHWMPSHCLVTSVHPPSTSITGLDVLSAASGPIQAAQQAAAEAWGAQASWFLVNGSTCGIHAAVMATCGPGQALILPRNAHLSAFNACVLAGCTPVYAQPCCDPHLGIAHHVTPTALQAAFAAAAERGLRVGAALVVSPTYFGVVADVAGGCAGAGLGVRAQQGSGQSCQCDTSPT